MRFPLHVKSTIDRKVADLSQLLQIPFVELDDSVNTDELLTSNKTCLVWRFIDMDEDPQDPLYSLSFVVGVKTTSDPSNYELLGIVSDIKNAFKKSEWIDVYDYSQVSLPVTPSGAIFITNSGVDPQVMDRQSGARMLALEARCMRNV